MHILVDIKTIQLWPYTGSMMTDELCECFIVVYPNTFVDGSYVYPENRSRFGFDMLLCWAGAAFDQRQKFFC